MYFGFVFLLNSEISINKLLCFLFASLKVALTLKAFLAKDLTVSSVGNCYIYIYISILFLASLHNRSSETPSLNVNFSLVVFKFVEP